jgi:hypothetical protein
MQTVVFRYINLVIPAIQSDIEAKARGMNPLVRRVNIATMMATPLLRDKDLSPRHVLRGWYTRCGARLGGGGERRLSSLGEARVLSDLTETPASLIASLWPAIGEFIIVFGYIIISVHVHAQRTRTWNEKKWESKNVTL